MTTVKLSVDPHQTPKEEAELVARVAQAVADETGDDMVQFELTKSEHVHVSRGVGDRMGRGARWSA
jgi:hypothetical protein